MRRLIWILLSSLVAGSGFAGDPNACDEPGDYPDVIVGALHEVRRWGTVGDHTAFSLGTTSCNVGTCELDWDAQNARHPVIAQNMFRLRDGRFEQIGQSWLKHGFFALSGSLCSDDCLGTNGRTLGVNCSDPYSAFLNGFQAELGPKSEIDASTGAFPFPPRIPGEEGDATFRRLRVHNDDIDPALNADALYFVEGQYVAADDARARRATNNASWAQLEFNVAGQPLLGPTMPTEPAIYAWQLHDREVEIVPLDIPGDGRILLGARVTRLGPDRWHYEYAVQNLNSHRSVRALHIPLSPDVTVSNPGFHDVDYHGGEPWDGTDWPHAISEHAIVWSTQRFADDPQANALRWGTLYNFRFDADVGPTIGAARIEAFRPGRVVFGALTGYRPLQLRIPVPGQR